MQHATYRDILTASSPGEVTEASLSRVWQHLESGDSWGIISAWRSDVGGDPKSRREANNRRTESLENDLRSMDYGYFPLKGRWKETDRDTGEDRWVEEESFFVPQIDERDVMELAKKYDQEAVVFGEPGDDGEIVLLYNDGSRDTLAPNSGEGLRPRQIADAYSEVKGHAFAFGEPPGGTTPQVSSSTKPLEAFHFRGTPSNQATALAEQVHPVEDLNERVDRFVNG